MNINNNKSIYLLLSTTTIIVAYIVLRFYQLITYAFFDHNAEQNMILIKTGSFLINCTLSILAYKHYKIATWLLSALMFVSGVGGLILSLFFIPFSQYFLKAISVILGVYFTCGGVILFKSVKNTMTERELLLNEKV